MQETVGRLVLAKMSQLNWDRDAPSMHLLHSDCPMSWSLLTLRTGFQSLAILFMVSPLAGRMCATGNLQGAFHCHFALEVMQASRMQHVDAARFCACACGQYGSAACTIGTILCFRPTRPDLSALVVLYSFGSVARP